MIQLLSDSFYSFHRKRKVILNQPGNLLENIRLCKELGTEWMGAQGSVINQSAVYDFAAFTLLGDIISTYTQLPLFAEAA